LLDSGLDFSEPHSVDFNVDFDQWPPSPAATSLLKSKFDVVEIYEQEDDFGGYILFTLNEIITYDLVMNIQSDVTKLMSEYGGVCESWGVLH
tara:strand:+ start:998 stop:1273 length:276 start_codon:yes stop_codon:yes gene_type:complete